MSIRVFTADDHAVVCDGLRLILETQPDIQVVGHAHNGREALTRILRLRPDAVVMDIGMPGLNGIEATRRIHELAPAIKIIILSMHDAPEYIYQAFKAGAQGYLLKTSAGREVINAVRAAIVGKRYLSSTIEDVLVNDYVSQRRGSVPKDPLELLSSREREILQLVVEGKSSAAIAELIYLSPKTVETYRSRLMHKLGINDIPSLVRFAIAHGIISID
jgi:DNA-binding NarL/FixJ family response regulator